MNDEIPFFVWQYERFVKPSFEEFILPSKKYADIIIPRGGDNDVAIDLIVQHIHTKLGQHDLCKIYSNVFVINSTFQVYNLSNLISIHPKEESIRQIRIHCFAFTCRFRECTRLYAM